MRTRKRITFLVLFFMYLASGIAQPQIKGKVIDSQDKEPVVRVIVKLIQVSNNHILAFTQTNNEGEFSFKKGDNMEEWILEFSSIGYAKKIVKLKEAKFPLQVELSISSVDLKEIIVTPPKIRAQGDTIIYNVGAFSSAHDRTIADVLKKMPGIEVESSGEIKYQGQSLNKFYIEGGDMLGGRYGLATNNISHDDVASVEVMEDHQPLKVVEGLVFSTQPAINIKLKEKAKSRWAGTLKGEGGIPSLWNAEAMAMRFKKKSQTFNTYKGNNAGKDYNDYNSFSSIGDFGNAIHNNQTSYINVSPAIPNNLERSRYLFNQFSTLTINNLNKLKNDIDLISEVILSKDKQTFENSSRTNIILDQDTLSVEDKKEETQFDTKNIEGKFQLKGNKKKSYINNDLKFKLAWDDTNMNTLGTYSNVQDVKIKDRQISNNFSAIWRTGNKVINFKTYNAYTEKPQDLKITRNGKSDIFQKTDLSSFISNTSSNYSFAINRKFRADTDLRYIYQNRKLDNILDSIMMNNNLQKYHLNLAIGLAYNHSSLYVKLNAPIYYQHLTYNHHSKSFFGVDPSLSAKWTLNSYVSLNSSLRMSQQLPQEYLLYNGYIQNNYRNISLGYEDFERGQNFNASVGMEYKNVLNMLFGNLYLRINKNQQKKRAEQFFIDEYIINTYTPHNVWANRYMANGTINKWLNLINGTVTLRSGYTLSTSDITRNNVTTPYKSRLFQVGANLNSEILKWLNLTYSASFSNNRMYMDKDKMSDINQFTESLELAFSFSSAFQMKASANHYLNEITDSNYKNFILADISASYLVGDRWEFICTAKNIFNHKYYTYTIENNQSTIWQEYKIRPFNILASATYRF